MICTLRRLSFKKLAREKQPWRKSGWTLLTEFRCSVYQEAIALARAFVEKGPIPEKAGVDALHIAIATTHGMDYLLTWNCKHIANAEMQTGVAKVSREAGFEPPVICTPEELFGS